MKQAIIHFVAVVIQNVALLAVMMPNVALLEIRRWARNRVLLALRFCRLFPDYLAENKSISHNL